MTTWHLLTMIWHGEPSVVVGCGGMFLAYAMLISRSPRFVARGHRPRATGWSGDGWHALLFTLGLAVLLFALISPLDTLGDTYLFSAHMAQHLLLVLVVPPLLLLGIPTWAIGRAFAVRSVQAVERILGQPAVAWCVGVVTLWLWHAPPWYGAALAGERIHIVQHLCFLVTATTFWWPVLAPRQYARLHPFAAALYLLLGALTNSVLGIMLTYAPAGLYPAYLHPADTLGILPLIRDSWRLSPEADQQLGGLLMWIVGGFIYLLAIIGTLGHWYAEVDEPDHAGEVELPCTRSAAKLGMPGAGRAADAPFENSSGQFADPVTVGPGVALAPSVRGRGP